MTQLSRPFQVALAAVGLLVVVWFVALRGHSSSSESTATTPAAASSPTSSSSSSPGSPSSVYHGSAPGVEGLTRDVQKAHGAVAQSERNAAQLQSKSAQASGDAASGAAHAAGGTSAATASSATHASKSATHASKSASAPKSARAHAKAAPRRSARGTHVVGGAAGQAWVEHELGRKTTVALLFYSPHSYADSRTRRELERLIGQERGRGVKIALRVAAGNEVGQYGSFTRVASVYQTPTLLLITPSGEVKPPITGLTDAFSIAQAIAEKTHP
jgi:hypothetical protein